MIKIKNVKKIIKFSIIGIIAIAVVFFMFPRHVYRIESEKISRINVIFGQGGSVSITDENEIAEIISDINNCLYIRIPKLAVWGGFRYRITLICSDEDPISLIYINEHVVEDNGGNLYIVLNKNVTEESLKGEQ